MSEKTCETCVANNTCYINRAYCQANNYCFHHAFPKPSPIGETVLTDLQILEILKPVISWGFYCQVKAEDAESRIINLSEYIRIAKQQDAHTRKLLPDELRAQGWLTPDEAGDICIKQYQKGQQDKSREVAKELKGIARYGGLGNSVVMISQPNFDALIKRLDK